MNHTTRDRKCHAWLLVLASALLLAPSAWAQTPTDIQAALDAAYTKYEDLKEGANADYIPALAKVDSEHLRHRSRHHRRRGLHRR